MSGELLVGTQLPSTQQFIDQYGASNTSVQSALSALKDEGFVSSRVGKGVFVRSSAPFVVQVGNYFEPSHRGYSFDMLKVVEVVPPRAVAEVYGLDQEGTAMLRHRLMSYDGDPVELSWSYYPADLAVGTALAGRGRIVGGAPRVLAELGYPQAYFRDRLSARPPTTEELEALDMPDDVPVMRQFRVIYTRQGRPVEVSIQVKGAHRYELEYEVPIRSRDD